MPGLGLGLQMTKGTASPAKIPQEGLIFFLHTLGGIVDPGMSATTWTDVITEGTPAVFNNVGAAIPVVTKDGYPAVDLTGGDYFSRLSTSQPVPFTVIAVVKREDSTGQSFGRIMNGNADRKVSLLFDGDGAHSKFFVGATASANSSFQRNEKDLTSDWAILIGRYGDSASPSTESKMRWNSANNASNLNTTAQATSGTYTLGFGTGGADGKFWARGFALYDRVLSDSECGIIENFFYNNFGIPKPSFFDKIPGLQNDFDFAQNVVLVDDAVDSITDVQSGVQADAPSGVRRPPYLTDGGNGKPGMQGDGASFILLNNAYSGLPSAHTIFTVVKPGFNDVQLNTGLNTFFNSGESNEESEFRIDPSQIGGDWTDHMKAVLSRTDPALWQDVPYDYFYAIDNFLYAIENERDSGGYTSIGLLIFPGITEGGYPGFESINWGFRGDPVFDFSGFKTGASARSVYIDSPITLQINQTTASLAFVQTRPMVFISLIDSTAADEKKIVIKEYGDVSSQPFAQLLVRMGNVSDEANFSLWENSLVGPQVQTVLSNEEQTYYAQRIYGTNNKYIKWPKNFTTTPAGTYVSPPNEAYTLEITPDGAARSPDFRIIGIGQKFADTGNANSVLSEISQFSRNGATYTYSGYPYANDPDNFPVLVKGFNLSYYNEPNIINTVDIDKSQFQVVHARTKTTNPIDIGLSGDIQSLGPNGAALSDIDYLYIGSARSPKYLNVGFMTIQRVLAYNKYLGDSDLIAVANKLAQLYNAPLFDIGSGLRIWLKASSVQVDDSGDVNAVDNLGTGGSSLGLFTQTPMTLVSGATPSGGVAIEHNGVDQFFESIGNIGITGAQARTIFAVVKSDVLSGNGMLVGFGDGSGTGTSFDLYPTLAGTTTGLVGNGANVSYANSNLDWRIIAVRFSGTNSSDVYLYEDGELKITVLSADQPLSTVDSLLRVGREPGTGSPTNPFDGQWAEIRVYNEDVGDERFAQIYSDLASLHEIPLTMQPFPLEVIEQMWVGEQFAGGSTWPAFYGGVALTKVGSPTSVADGEIGLDVVNMPGIGSYFTASSLNNTLGVTADRTILAAFKQITSASGFWGAVIAQGRGNSSEDFVMFATFPSGVTVYSSHGGDTFNVNPKAPDPASMPQDWLYATFRTEHLVSKKEWINGNLEKNQTSGLDYNTSGVVTFYVGRTSNNNSEMIGRLAVIITCHSAISEENRLLIEQWIQNYTGI